MFTPIVLTLIIHVEVWVVSTPIVLTLIIHVEVWVVGVYTHCTYTDHTCTPTVLTLIIHVEVWVVVLTLMFTPTVLTLIIHVEVWVFGTYTVCRGLGGWCLHPLYLH